MDIFHIVLQGIPPWVWLTLLCLTLLMWWRADRRDDQRRARRARVARRAEEDAESLLERLGYDIVDRQVAGSLSLYIDDEPVPIHCRADLLVRRGPHHYVAEVKSGDLVTDPTHPSTRRQLLEYQLAFDVDGILLVDMSHMSVHEVAFDLDYPPNQNVEHRRM